MDKEIVIQIGKNKKNYAELLFHKGIIYLKNINICNNNMIEKLLTKINIICGDNILLEKFEGSNEDKETILKILKEKEIFKHSFFN